MQQPGRQMADGPLYASGHRVGGWQWKLRQIVLLMKGHGLEQTGPQIWRSHLNNHSKGKLHETDFVLFYYYWYLNVFNRLLKSLQKAMFILVGHIRSSSVAVHVLKHKAILMVNVASITPSLTLTSDQSLGSTCFFHNPLGCPANSLHVMGQVLCWFIICASHVKSVEFHQM